MNFRARESSRIAISIIVMAFIGILLLMPFHPVGTKKRPLVLANSQEEYIKRLNALSTNDRKSLREKEIRSLAKSPLDTQAIYNLSVLAELDGDLLLRDKLVAEGARRSRRDPQLQFAALQAAYKEKNFEKLVNILDGLMRSRPEYNSKTFEVAASIISDERGLRALLKSIASQPPWRKHLIDHLIKKDAGGNFALKLLMGAKKVGIEVQDSEVRGVLLHLITNNLYDRAHYVWLEFLSKESLEKAGNVFDGGFDLDLRWRYFDWTISSTPNVKAELGLRFGSGNNRALFLVFSGYNNYYTNVGQLLRLAPGTYSVSAEFEARSYKTTGGLAWRVTCLTSQYVAGQSKTFKTDGPWDTFNFDVNVPATGCETQHLQLVTAGATKLDFAISGLIAFDNFRIVPSNDD